MVLLLHDTSDIAAETIRVLSALPSTCPVELGSREAPRAPVNAVVLAVDLDEPDRLRLAVQHLRARQPETPLVLVTRSNGWADRSRATMLGATRSLPVEHVGGLLADPAILASLLRGPVPASSPALREAVVRAAGALSRAMTEGGVNSSDAGIQGAATAVIDAVASAGLGPFAVLADSLEDAVLRHVMHVMGLAVAFGLAAELPSPWLRKISAASLLHDVGKAKVSRAILDKAGPLTRDERDEMRTHPKHGADMLREAGEADGDVIDAVLHHHELMDGTGYPHRLTGGTIRPMTRMLTIADIFAALVEQRSYKAAMTQQAAFEHLLRMGSKLDQGLVATFRRVALVTAA